MGEELTLACHQRKHSACNSITAGCDCPCHDESINPWQCDECNTIFADQATLDLHKRASHSGNAGLAQQFTLALSTEDQKPAVTQAQYEAGRAVLDALPAGVYLHCSGCGVWKRNGRVQFMDNNVYCEGCAF